ncbi:Hypothetical protein CINCED_3A016201 [Cinara cedri]|uniref:Uncharacterized protein n=1 Tax=Cinara cedri TaxID=506608 RepID=A0A5E4MCN3_9HEMI|nr:Hypothetical protein CINCED_3A016201 [Cinara cedri]
MLSRINDAHLKVVRDLEKKPSECQKRLGGVLNTNVRVIRSELRKAKFNHWKTLPQRDIGVTSYEHCMLTNGWVSNKISLTCRKWAYSLKISMNSMAKRTTGGRS